MTKKKTIQVEDNIDLDLAKGTQPIRAGIRVGGGAEYNISGTTSLFFSLHYNYFITNGTCDCSA